MLRLTYKTTTDLDGYDAFGRVVFMRHYPPSGGPPEGEVKLTYGYDTASNPLYKEDCVTAANSELYTYDSAHRLIDMKRGTLNAQKTGISGTVSFTRDRTQRLVLSSVSRSEASNSIVFPRPGRLLGVCSTGQYSVRPSGTDLQWLNPKPTGLQPATGPSGDRRTRSGSGATSGR